jgi:hypothetical protein
MSTDVVSKLVGILMMSRTYGHLCHLKTSSYAKHMALNEFYTGVVELLDSMAEAAQGKMGKLDIPYIDLKGDVNDPINGISSHLTMIENLGKKCDDRTLNAILDTITELYYSTLYKLKELD